jgi:hypothetical protein
MTKEELEKLCNLHTLNQELMVAMDHLIDDKRDASMHFYRDFPSYGPVDNELRRLRRLNREMYSILWSLSREKPDTVDHEANASTIEMYARMAQRVVFKCEGEME